MDDAGQVRGRAEMIRRGRSPLVSTDPPDWNAIDMSGADHLHAGHDVIVFAALSRVRGA
jgi:hypothetical protein